MPVSLGSFSGKTDTSSLDENIQLLSILDAASEIMGKDDTCLFMPTIAATDVPQVDDDDDDDDDFDDTPELDDDNTKDNSDKKKAQRWRGTLTNFLNKLKDVAEGGDIKDDDDDDE